MSEGKKGKVISAGELDWKKGDDYRDKFSEVTTVIVGGRSVILDFGALEEAGKKGGEKELESIDPYTLSMLSQSEEIMNFNKIHYEDKEIKLRTPIEIKLKLSNQRYILHYEPLGIILSAPTVEECKEDFQEELDVLYEVIAREDDENLITSAQILKRKLLNMIADET